MFQPTILLDPNIIIVGHNIKFDIKFIEKNYGIKHKCKLFDTSILHALIDENSNDNQLKQLAATYTTLGHYEDNIDVTNLVNEPFDKVIVYNCLDSIAPLLLFEKLFPIAQKEGLVKVFNFLSEMLSIFVEIEQNGVYINKNKLFSLYQKHTIIRDSVKNKHPKTKLSSDTEIRKILYEHFNCPKLAWTKGDKPSTSKDTLNALLVNDNVSEQAKNFIQDILDFRLSNKLLTDHLPRIADNLYNDRFYSTYNLAKGYDESGINRGTVTGRLSSSPNIQNIPTQADIREIFTVSPDYKYFVTADYSQIELRVAAFLSREPNFIKAFNEGRDVHTSVMCDITKQDYNEINLILKDDNHKWHRKWYDYRLAVKRVNFGIMYGIGAKHLVKLILQMGVKLSEAECSVIIQDWYSQNTTLISWIRKTQDEIIRDGIYRTIFGRIRHLPGANRRTDMGSRVLRQGINFPIQSAASDICLLGIKNLQHRFTMEVESFNRLLMTVHDEISFETKYTEPSIIIALTKQAMILNVISDMQTIFGINFDIPLEVDIHIGEYWKK